MEVLEAIYYRRAVRSYTGETVAHDVLLKLIDAAIQAPSARNEQPWSFAVITDRTLLAAISEKAKAHLLKTSAAGLALHRFSDTIARDEFDVFYGAPALIVLSAEESAWTVQDCSLAAQNLMLAACAFGLGTCWIGFAEAWLSGPEGRQVLSLPKGHLPVAPIIVGHPRSATPAVPRKAARVHWIPAEAHRT